MSTIQLSDLASQRCQPRRGAEHLLLPSRSEAALTALPGWAVVENGEALSKTYNFADYYRTLAFVNALAFVAHAEDHHPDLSVHYNRCVVRFSTHDVGGLSENDLICAAKVETLIAAG
ncbi:4a-hydroxytetrahydrobiopterin dehydratase [Aquimonas sp.]|jgi:4a-hydroxytetrahydrobiopterin dehydratase|uniref:4a-hydroxytetrahydrobiopterin dehydratase n=1 Tax=Aquimonas sp. TaxID=1872588 RepID=UPI0037C1635A